MELTTEQFASFRQVSQQLIQWMRENCHPHCTVIVDRERAELLEGQAVCKAAAESKPA